MIGALSGIVWEFPVYLTLALGMYLSLRVCGFPDFTVDGSFALGMAGLFVGIHYFADSAVVGGVVAALLGGIAGALTAVIYGYGFKPDGLYKLIAGLLVMFSATSVTFRLLGKSESQNLGRKPHFLAAVKEVERNLGLLPWRWLSISIMVAVLLVVIFLLARYLRQRQGILLRATGLRPLAVRVLGRPSQHYLLLGLVAANAIVGVGGWMYGVMNDSITFLAPGRIVDALGALLIGEAIYDRFSGRRRVDPRHALAACFVGALAYSFAKGLAAYMLAFALGDSFIPQDHRFIVSVLILLTVILSGKGVQKYAREAQVEVIG